jgi:hypothetical protein
MNRPEDIVPQTWGESASHLAGAQELRALIETDQQRIEFTAFGLNPPMTRS